MVLIATSAVGQNLDIDLLRKINLKRAESLDPAMLALSRHTTAVSVAAPVAILALGLSKKDSALTHKGVYVAASLLGAATVSTILKYSINRTRPFITYPDIEKLDKGRSPSFPSGHTSDAFATATSLSIAFPKWYIIVPAYLWAGGVAYSRMHLGVHYPSDVLAGALTGSGSAWLTWKLNKWVTQKYFVKKRQQR
jgi:membrane-associated phospholipid phosphatase